ncbi:TetR/AcrR family transcriptional regulator [Aerosakkonema funiforme]|uniref:TetR/AcrR family transcriptional regulator n=1 Tax=Aerosakkonema funiforme FACHB-1375 TaxID=2949571 RepID=A0A926ZK55_9CYAN|nr:TetR/AcrR family transcriptional regulator [Aerosakkonema funiforme]MBD2186248.1 TetR/AcrR family transcriptional regulator [Aerosakkonema funiforme FACHB-1375]
MSGKKTYHHGDLRQALVDEAIALIAEKDVSSLSLREVARRIGVSHTASYRHFEDKEALLAAVAQEGFMGLTKALNTALAVAESHSLRRLEAIGVGYVQYAIAHPSHYRVMFGAYRGNPDKYPLLEEAGKEAFGVLVNAIEAGQIAGTIRSGESRQLAWVAWSLVHGLAMLLMDGQLSLCNTKEVESLATFVTETLVRGLALNH